jgi:Arc/MetJ-type ribon-helix-helix transcriptional regulator
MKVSVSLPDDDVAFVDRYAQDNGTTRSAAIHQAVQMLRRRDLADDYEAATDEWADSGEAAVWDAVTGDGLR